MPKPDETVTITAGTPTAIKEIFELAVYEKEIFHNYEYKTTWLASTKRIILRGKYRIKYGVAPSSAIKLKGISDKIARLTNAPITVLSCEPIAGTLKVEEEPGLWNKLTNEERTKARNDMQDFVRNEAEKNRESKAYAMKQLLNLLNDRIGSGKTTIEPPPGFLPL